MSLEAFCYKRGSLDVLDQVKLPREHTFIKVTDTIGGWNVINKMNVSSFEAHQQRDIILSRAIFKRERQNV